MSSAAGTGGRWVWVARAGDVAPGRVRRVEADGWVLALLNRAGTFYALEAVCPHQGGPLDQGQLWRGALECPWHHHRYDPATGRNVYPANTYPEDMPHLREQLRPARVFAVEVRGDGVYVRLPGRDSG